MNEDTVVLEELRVWFDGYVEPFLRRDDAFRRNIEIKQEHTRRVCMEIVDLATSVGLGAEDIAFSEALALLHDVGRFEQFDRYGTFSDQKSENHAQLGIRILEENHVLDRLAPTKRDLFYRCIGNHNRLRLPKNETERCLFFSRLLRDADKLDIWRVVTDYHATSGRLRNPALELDLPRSPKISDKIADAVLACRLADIRDLQTYNDFKVLQMSWVFDLNFPRTFQLVDTRKYLEKTADSLPRNERVTSICRTVRSFLNTQLSRKEIGSRRLNDNVRQSVKTNIQVDIRETRRR